MKTKGDTGVRQGKSWQKLLVIGLIVREDVLRFGGITDIAL